MGSRRLRILDGKLAKATVRRLDCHLFSLGSPLIGALGRCALIVSPSTTVASWGIVRVGMRTMDTQPSLQGQVVVAILIVYHFARGGRRARHGCRADVRSDQRPW
jgi:hypothetical protein